MNEKDNVEREIQLRLLPKRQIQQTYSGEQLNEIIGETQRIETSRGCIRNCPFCYEPTKRECFDIPEITKGFVQIIDMNFLLRADALEIIRKFGKTKVNNRVVYYEETSGFDYRLMTQEIANGLKKARFIKPRIAWDWEFKDQMKIKDNIDMLKRAGYRSNEIGIFVIVNWWIPRVECERKLDLLKVWNVHVCDCCYDGGYAHAVPEHWIQKDINEFKARCRKHNQLVNFGVDPEA